MSIIGYDICAEILEDLTAYLETNDVFGIKYVPIEVYFECDDMIAIRMKYADEDEQPFEMFMDDSGWKEKMRFYQEKYGIRDVDAYGGYWGQ